MQSVDKLQTPFPSGSKEEGIYLYKKMKEAERWELLNPRPVASEEQVIAANMRVENATTEAERAEAMLDASSLMLLGRESDGLYGNRPRSSAGFRKHLLENADFNDTSDIHLLYEELLARKEAGEVLDYKQLTADDWTQLRGIEGVTHKSLVALFEKSSITLSNAHIRLGVKPLTDEQGYLLEKTREFKIKFPHLTSGHRTNYIFD